ncbi:hypothetical protein EST38_g1106 [Candolleomyces aberdarensis]|uniref:Endonuclease/exonuclease/phosphatase domain-containing protein n=1 Tax=Candolleomyces aberdarensis TaxID=2316362 RepID=A0A4Q2DX10_9AGAR|nr:hypothetical protein EST38_g1106 [Candolleomyces aberdarensis]
MTGRELFPTSDCLKAHQREHLIHEEIERQDADILCLQEVDRLEKLCPMLEKAGYSHQYASGPNKKHGCLIAFKSSLFSLSEHKIVFYDDEEISPDETPMQKVGQSFVTRNISLIVGLQKLDNPDLGITVATTHLFWHPRYTYERARQAGILKREVTRFGQSDALRQGWPSVLAGDFNFTPPDPAYSLLTRTTLLPEHEEILRPSYVVHRSVDPTVPLSPSQPAAADADEGGGVEAQDPDRVITNARMASPSDGLLDSAGLVKLYSESPEAKSAYDATLSRFLQLEPGQEVPIFGSTPEPNIDPTHPGFHEPAYTSYTHYWKSVLDYIFVLKSDKVDTRFTGVLAPLPGNALEPGLPQKAICGSDHLPLVTEVRFNSL